MNAARTELDLLREEIRQGKAIDGKAAVESVAQRAIARLEQELRPRLRPVINATGIVLHTNLGRAPMATVAAEAAHQAAQGYLNLELQLDSGKRSSRQQPIREWLCRLTGAESATVVNNNAAATVLVLRALCRETEVVLSRGQMIEIGGSFRIPDIMAVSGAILREVGTTNITRLEDYARVIGPQTGALLQIHTSNYRVQGFTKAVPLADLVRLGHQHELLVIDDVGSGAMVDFSRYGFTEEPIVRDSIEAGADVVLFSGDKLLGGPQAGMIVGKAELIQKLEKDPLMRAFRLDKMTLAALEATLRLYLDPEQALQSVPVLRMLGIPIPELHQRAKRMAQRLDAIPSLATVKVNRDKAFVGGGSLPAQEMETVVVALEAIDLSDEQFAYRLRNGDPAVMPRIQDGKVLLDLRTIREDQEEKVIQAIESATAQKNAESQGGE